MPLLATKLFRPPPRPGTVLRHQLFARLSEGLARKLTLVAAPAGSGKTTLVSAWAAAADLPAAWLSLDPDDGEPVRFLSYVLAALQTVRPTLGRNLLTALQSPQPPPLEALLTDLLNALAALPERLILVLDDYHVIDSDPVDRALAFLVAHLPPQLHLVIVTREDPALPLAQLRARGQLSELRLAELCFATDKATTFFAEATGLRLAEAEVAALVERTEGWAAGLHLAALSLRGHQDAAGFVTPSPAVSALCSTICSKTCSNSSPRCSSSSCSARQCLAGSVARCVTRSSPLIDWPFRWRLAQARIEESSGNWEAALDLLDAAERRYLPNPVPDLRPVAALKARVYLRQGNLVAATAWVAACGVTATDALSYLREFEHLTLARMLVAKLTRSVIARYRREHVAGDLHDALDLLTRLLAAAEAGGRIGS